MSFKLPPFLKRYEKHLRVPAPLKRPVQIAWTLVQDFDRCDLLKQASAMAYVTLLSLIPSLVAIFCVLSLFSPLAGPNGNVVNQVKDFVLQNLASGSGEAVVAYLDRMLSKLSLSTIGWSSFASVLVTLILLLRQIEEALNRIWLVRKARNVFKRFMYFWTFLTLGVVAVAAALGVSSGFDLQKLLSLAPAAQDTGGITGAIVPTVGGFIFFFFLYKIVPNCRVATRNAAIGAAIASVTLLQAGRFYGMYVQRSENYETLYGALAQLPIFLLWLYICWAIILMGALLSWRIQEGFPEEQAKDTLDQARTPLEAVRNSQVKAAMPMIALLAIYKNFQQGTGKGLSAQDLAHALKLPAAWVGEALEALEAMGYVIQSHPDGSATEEAAGTVVDPYYPAFPPASLPMGRVKCDLAKPLDTWLTDWRHELAFDLPKMLAALAKVDARPDAEKPTLAEILTELPGLVPPPSAPA